jgi:hypothetical protein
MSQELIDAANALKAAADRLLELAQKPTPTTIDFANMSDEAKEALRLLINPWLEYEYKRRLDATLEAIDKKIEDFSDNMPDWDDCERAKDEAENAVSRLEGYPDASDLDRVMKKLDEMPEPDDLNDVVEQCNLLPSSDDLEKMMNDLRKMPDPKQVEEAVDVALALPPVDKIVSVDMIAEFLGKITAKDKAA